MLMLLETKRRDRFIAGQCRLIRDNWMGMFFYSHLNPMRKGASSGSSRQREESDNRFMTIRSW